MEPHGIEISEGGPGEKKPRCLGDGQTEMGKANKERENLGGPVRVGKCYLELENSMFIPLGLDAKGVAQNTRWWRN